ncbi:MAG: HIG1 domain-containing protein [Holosporales bacterium]
MNISIVILILLCLATLAVLLVGLLGMAGSGEFNKKYGNTLMRVRVGLQAATLAYFAFYVFFLK